MYWSKVRSSTRWKITFAKRLLDQRRIRDLAEIESYGQYESVIESSRNFDDRQPIRFPDIQQWEKLSEKRSRIETIREMRASRVRRTAAR